MCTMCLDHIHPVLPPLTLLCPSLHLSHNFMTFENYPLTSVSALHMYMNKKPSSMTRSNHQESYPPQKKNESPPLSSQELPVTQVVNEI